MEPAQSGIDAIRAHDPAFDESAFLADTQRAFFVVQEAWTQLKPETSRRVMADGLWQQHKVQIEQYVAEHKRNVLEDLAVGDVSVASAHSDDTYDTITVRLLAACADYDIAVFLRDLTDRWGEARRLSVIETDILAETGAFIHSMPYAAGAYRQRTPMMHEIRRDGIEL